jgi:carboxymethylenebutenolidase
MGLRIDNVTYGKGEYSGYLAMPSRAAGPLPAVVVIQEAWGLDEHIEDVARRFALAGYAALAPDLYASKGVRPAPFARDRMAELLDFVNQHGAPVFMDESKRQAALATLPEDRRARVSESLATLFGGIRDLGAYVPALLAATAYLREDNERTRGQKIGSIGYCMGGGLSGLLACHDPNLAAACIYYGSAPPADLVPRIACPVYGFYGGNDKRIMDALPAFTEAMAKAGKQFESQVYGGAEHAFFNDERPSYHVAASRDAFARTLEVFRRHLGG